MRPQAPRDASPSRLGSRAVSSSDFPVSGRGSPPRPSRESSTILVALSTTSGAMTSSILALRGLGILHGILEHAETGDLQPARVARLHEHGGLLAEAHARRRPRRDEVARLEGHQAREVAHDVADVEDELAGVAVLHRSAV